MPAPCRPCRTQAELQLLCPKTTLLPSRCSLQHHSQTEQDVGCSWVLPPRGSPGSGDPWRHGMQPQNQGLVSGRSATPWGSTGYVSLGTREAEGMAIQPKSSPACLHMLACPHVLVGVEHSNSFFFQLHYAHCDNRRLNCEQHNETSEIDVSISWYSIPGMTCLLCPLTVLVEAYQNTGHMFSNSIAGIQLEKCVSLNDSHMLCIPLQHIISCSICTEFDTA